MSSSAVRVRPGRIGLLFALYFVQGLPFGFQATALPIYLRASGVSLVGVGFAGALALPWMLKALWAPLVDRFGSARFGRRRSWIVPLQVLLAGSCAAAALVAPGRELGLLLALVFLMNLLAATEDIAVDGLAVDILAGVELGWGNAAQVVGYKTGMLTGGGLLVWFSGFVGWPGLFGGMALLVAIALVPVLLWREPAPAAEVSARKSLRKVLTTLLDAARLPGTLPLLAFIGTYKLGEAMVDAMFKPFLVDAGFAPEQIGLFVGTYGMICSLLGSLAGGRLATGQPLVKAVFVAAVIRVVPMLGEAWLALGGQPGAGAVIAVTCAEHFAGGLLTTTVFALMMSRVDRRVGASHYTLLATVEVLGKSPGIWASGLLATWLGYAGLFGLGALLSLAFLLLLLPLRATPGQS